MASRAVSVAGQSQNVTTHNTGGLNYLATSHLAAFQARTSLLNRV
jgi:hypothetical protein